MCWGRLFSFFSRYLFFSFDHLDDIFRTTFLLKSPFLLGIEKNLDNLTIISLPCIKHLKANSSGNYFIGSFLIKSMNYLLNLEVAE